MEVRELGQVLEGARLDAADLVVGQVEVNELLHPLEGLGSDLSELTVLHVQRDESLAFTEGPRGYAAQVVPLQVQQTGDLRHPRDLLEPDAVADDVLKVTVAVAQAGALARGSLHRGAQDQEAGPQQQPAHTTHADELVNVSLSADSVSSSLSAEAEKSCKKPHREAETNSEEVKRLN